MTRTYTSWLLIALGVAAWIGVGYAAWVVVGMSDERVVELQASDTKRTESALSMRAHTLAESTRDERSQLSTIFTQDAPDMISVVEQAAKDAGVSIKIGQASVASSVTEGLNAVDLVADINGTFPGIVRAIGLLDVLPIPSTVRDFQVTYAPDRSQEPGWRASVHMRFLTSQSISS